MKIFIDKRLPEEVIVNKGFTRDGFKYEYLFYHYFKDTKHSNTDLIITKNTSTFYLM